MEIDKQVKAMTSFHHSTYAERKRAAVFVNIQGKAVHSLQYGNTPPWQLKIDRKSRKARRRLTTPSNSAT
jgi:hypothetical protein